MQFSFGEVIAYSAQPGAHDLITHHPWVHDASGSMISGRADRTKVRYSVRHIGSDMSYGFDSKGKALVYIGLRLDKVPQVLAYELARGIARGFGGAE